MKTKILLIVALVVFACALPAFGGDNVDAVTIVSYAPTVTPIPTLSPIEQYAQAIEEDNQARVESFTVAAIASGSSDYSGLGYSACVVDSDCLVGEQTCKAGTVPNTIPMPGYCVPVFERSE